MVISNGREHNKDDSPLVHEKRVDMLLGMFSPKWVLSINAPRTLLGFLNITEWYELFRGTLGPPLHIRVPYNGMRTSTFVLLNLGLGPNPHAASCLYRHSKYTNA